MYKLVATLIAGFLTLIFVVPTVTDFTSQVSGQMSGMTSLERTLEGSFDQVYSITD